MRKTWAGFTLIFLTMLAATSLLSYARTGAEQTGAKAAPGDSPLITFLKKALAAASDEFVAFKGAEKELVKGDKKGTMFQGTLAPAPDSDCTLYPRSAEDPKLLPRYSCQLHEPQTFEEAKEAYEKAAAELRAAYPDWKFEEKKSGDETKRQESWTLTATHPGATLTLNLFDWGMLSDLLSGKPSGKPGVIVSLTVTDTAREKEKAKTGAAKEMTANLPICRFVEKVRAANKDNFAAIRTGGPTGLLGEYAGTLRPDARSKCKVMPDVEGTTSGRSYNCELRRAETLEELEPEYDRLKTELQACYSNLSFKEVIRDKKKNPEDSMYLTGSYLTGKNTLFEIELDSRDDPPVEKSGGGAKTGSKLLRLQIRILQ